MHDEFLAKSIVDLVAILDSDKGVNSLASEFIGNADDSGFSNGVVLDEGGFDFGGGETVA